MKDDWSQIPQMAPFSFQEFQKTLACPWSQKAMWSKHPVHLQKLQAPQNLPSQPKPEPQRKNQRLRREGFVIESLLSSSFTSS